LRYRFRSLPQIPAAHLDDHLARPGRRVGELPDRDPSLAQKYQSAHLAADCALRGACLTLASRAQYHR
jgi:hypothetical protein